MDINSLKGGAEGIANVMEMHRMVQAENGASQQAQNKLSRPEPQGQGAANTETGVAVQGLGENLNRMV